MTARRIERLLKQALLLDGEMKYELYKHELEELVNDWKASMAKDKDDYLFAVTENSGHVSMVLIERSGRVHINEQARERLKALWQAAYESNLNKLIPTFADLLRNGEIPVNGIKVVSGR